MAKVLYVRFPPIELADCVGSVKVPATVKYVLVITVSGEVVFAGRRVGGSGAEAWRPASMTPPTPSSRPTPAPVRRAALRLIRDEVT